MLSVQQSPVTNVRSAPKETSVTATAMNEFSMDRAPGFQRKTTQTKKVLEVVLEEEETDGKEHKSAREDSMNTMIARHCSTAITNDFVIEGSQSISGSSMTSTNFDFGIYL